MSRVSQDLKEHVTKKNIVDFLLIPVSRLASVLLLAYPLKIVVLFTEEHNISPPTTTLVIDMTLLTDLPVELGMQIADSLDTGSRLALVRTCHYLYEVVTPVIYGHDARKSGCSAFFWAASHGRLETLRNAIAVGVNVNIFGSYTRNKKSFKAVRVPKPPGQWLVGEHAHYLPERCHLKYGTALHLAVKKGHDDVVAFLLANGAEIDGPSRRLCECGLHPDWGCDGPRRVRPTFPSPPWTPLHLAICGKRISTVKLLIDRGASVVVAKSEALADATRSYHVTALHSAAAVGLTEVIRLLRSSPGANLDVNDEGGHYATALHYATQCFDGASAESTIFELADMKADTELRGGERNSTPLASACLAGNFPAALALLRVGAKADVKVEGFDGLTLLQCCAKEHALLTNSGVSREDRESAEKYRLELVSELVQAGAGLEARCKSGSRETALITAAAGGNAAVVRKLLELGASTEARDNVGATAVYRATQSLNSMTLRILLESGANPDVCAYDETPLMLAASGGTAAQVTLLIDHGAKVDAANDVGDTALMVAIDGARLETTRALLDAGADASHLNTAGETALHKALYDSAEFWAACAKILLECGAPLSVVDTANLVPSQGEGALMMAIRSAVHTPPFGSYADSSWDKKVEFLLRHCKKQHVTPTLLETAIEFCLQNKAWTLAKKLGTLIHRLQWSLDGAFASRMVEASIKANNLKMVHCILDLGPRRGKLKTTDGTVTAKILVVLAMIRKQGKLAHSLLVKLGKDERSLVEQRIALIGSEPTFLHLVASMGDFGIMTHYIKADMDVNVADRMSTTPLMMAIIHGNINAAFWLISHGADPFARLPPFGHDQTGRPRDTAKRMTCQVPAALSDAFSQFDRGNLELLGPEPLSAFELAIKLSRLSILAGMLNKFALPLIRPRSPFSYVHRACQCGDPAILELLLSKGANPDGGRDCPSPPLTCLLRGLCSEPEVPAKLHDTIRDITKLLRNGADIEKRDQGTGLNGAQMMELRLGYAGHDEWQRTVASRLAQVFRVVKSGAEGKRSVLEITRVP